MGLFNGYSAFLFLSSLLVRHAASNSEWNRRTFKETHSIYSADECYHIGRERNSTVAITALLPPVPRKQDGIFESLQNLRISNNVDLVLFYSGNWSVDSIDELKQKLGPSTTHVRCIASSDWVVHRRFAPWEFVETGYHGPGYRSMCRWYSRRVSAEQKQVLGHTTWPTLLP